MTIPKEVMGAHREALGAHREALEHWARLYETDGGEGTASVADFLRRAARVMGRIVGDPAVPDEPAPKEPSVEQSPQG
jgi:hypothetical protein